jgi:hypothetical protein
MLWNTTWGYHGENTGYDIALDSADNMYLCGETQYYASNYLGVLKFNIDGNFEWNTTWGDSSASPYGLAIDSAGNIYVCGEIIPNMTRDVLLLKFESAFGTNFLIYLIIILCIIIGVVAVAVIVLKKRGTKGKGHWITKDGRRIFIKDKE